ncbi:hypothetical protein ApiMCR8900_00180 [Acinetobacter pittii]|nr:hypothetical protein ApiMCR8900_00180 [Acinetobacter pittii]
MSESDPFRKTKSKTQCQIDDNQARAVQRLILNLMGQSEVMDGSDDRLLISWSEMVNDERTQYGFIGYE